MAIGHVSVINGHFVRYCVYYYISWLVIVYGPPFTRNRLFRFLESSLCNLV